MREVTVFYAYDDTEFFDRSKCLAYEEKAYTLMRSIEKKFSFFDRNKNEVIAPLDSFEIENWLDWLESTYACCGFCRRKDNLTEDETNFIVNNIGACIMNEDFNYMTGLFRYDGHRNEWVKVDE